MLRTDSAGQRTDVLRGGPRGPVAAALIVFCLFVRPGRSDDAVRKSAQTQPNTTTAPTTPGDAVFEALVHQLGHADFAVRQRAQQRLEAAGAAALPCIVRHLNHPDPEVRRRLTELIRPSHEVRRRAELAAALLATGDREQLRRAVLFLFETPTEELMIEFERAAEARGGLAAAVSKPIVGELRMWRAAADAFERNAPRIRDTDPAAFERLRIQHDELRASRAEAAYYLGLDVREEHAAVSAATRPARGDDR
jgi:hypothetical protein